MSSPRTSNIRVLALIGTILTVMTGLVVYSPTLYQLFCAVTGYGGTVQRAIAKQPDTASTNEKVTVSFDANVAPGLPWEFRSEQRRVETRFGEPTKVYYYAKNNSDETVVARAVFNVTPNQTAPYFFKIECFCFTEEKLAPGESARMPLVFYVDEHMLKDKDAEMFRNITLSYTFFRQKQLSPEEVEAARDLKAGSQATEAKLKKAETVGFDNDAPRR
ncbi:cytochrome c oxidase assembly protein [Mesorhizobium xinjiangense]|uniref:cytochrome c oxidase assembly protein n=1 Tax=Mesorhizobium xinjiangense TaxID=2678685 RepID=UPI0012EDF6EA|nr:cytochrome c oxidase assembly protein [Mesorhizobium xinjiangense]